MMCLSPGALEKLGITASLDKQELAELGEVVQIRTRSGDVELEWRATRQRLAPEELVVPPEGGTESVRILSGRRVGPEVEGDVDRLAQTHVSTVHPSPTAMSDHIRSRPLDPQRPRPGAGLML